MIMILMNTFCLQKNADKEKDKKKNRKTHKHTRNVKYKVHISAFISLMHNKNNTFKAAA